MNRSRNHPIIGFSSSSSDFSNLLVNVLTSSSSSSMTSPGLVYLESTAAQEFLSKNTDGHVNVNEHLLISHGDDDNDFFPSSSPLSSLSSKLSSSLGPMTPDLGGETSDDDDVWWYWFKSIISSSHETTISDDLTESQVIMRLFGAVLCILLILTTLFGNFLVVIVVAKNHRMRTVTNVLLARYEVLCTTVT